MYMCSLGARASSSQTFNRFIPGMTTFEAHPEQHMRRSQANSPWLILGILKCPVSHMALVLRWLWVEDCLWAGLIVECFNVLVCS